MWLKLLELNSENANSWPFHHTRMKLLSELWNVLEQWWYYSSPYENLICYLFRIVRKAKCSEMSHMRKSHVRANSPRELTELCIEDGNMKQAKNTQHHWSHRKQMEDQKPSFPTCSLQHGLGRRPCHHKSGGASPDAAPFSHAIPLSLHDYEGSSLNYL